MFVSGGGPGAGLATSQSTDGANVVSCGQAPAGEQLIIADPGHHVTAGAEGKIGEIWVSGDHVASGYWGKPELSKQNLSSGARYVIGGPYLRTGDLGFLRKGELYFVGRLKDLITCNGLRLHAEDIEKTAAVPSRRSKH